MRKQALVIGINYVGTPNELGGCINDAFDWRDALAARGYQVKTMLEGEATKAAVLGEMAEMVAQAVNGDHIVVTYSGHGTWLPDASGDEPDGRDEALVPVDFMRAGVITDDELDVTLGVRVRGVRIVLVTDSCFSGTVARFGPTLVPPGHAAPPRVKFLPPAALLSATRTAAADRLAARVEARGDMRSARPRRSHKVLSLAAAQDWEYAYDASFGGRGNGAFTYVALRALGALQAGATYKDWYNAIRAALPNAEFPQRPALIGETSQKAWPALS